MPHSSANLGRVWPFAFVVLGMQFNFVVVNLVVRHLRFCRRNNRLLPGLFHWAGGGCESEQSEKCIDEWWCLFDFILPKTVNLHTECRPDVSATLFSSSCSNHVQFYVTGWWYWCCFVPLLEESCTLLGSLNSHHPLHWDADGVGFIFSNKLPCPKNIQKTLGKQEPVVHCIFEGLKMNHFPEVSSERLFRWYRQLQVLQGWATTMSIDTAEFAQQLSATVAWVLILVQVVDIGHYDMECYIVLYFAIPYYTVLYPNRLLFRSHSSALPGLCRSLPTSSYLRSSGNFRRLVLCAPSRPCWKTCSTFLGNTFADFQRFVFPTALARFRYLRTGRICMRAHAEVLLNTNW